MLVHIHIPKNAGSTMRQLLKCNFKSRLAEFYTHRRGRFLTDDEFLAYLSTLPDGTAALTGHDLRPLSPMVSAEHGIRYFTFLRDPIRRAISLYHYERKVAGSRDAQHVSLLPFEQYVEERPKYDRAISNWQVHNLSATGNLDDARYRLEAFLMVGLVERFDESLLLLRERCHERRLAVAYRKENVSAKPIVRLAGLSRNVLARLQEMNALDIALYEYGCQRFERDLRTVAGLAAKLTLLRMRNRVPIGV